MFERFTERARQVVVLAQEEARILKHNYIGTEHILLGLLREEEGLAARVLESLDITVERVRAQVVRIVGSGEEVTSGQIPFTPRAKKVLELALREALSPRPQLHRHRAHPARPGARERGRRRPHPARLRRRLGEDPQRGHPHAVRPRRPPAPAVGRRRGAQGEGKKTSKLLDQFGRNLTKLAAEGKLDPVVGRETEIERIMQILSRRTEEQPGADRRAGRRQDRRRRGPRPADHQRRGARAAARTSRSTRSTWPRSSPARSTAASSRSASRR